MAAGTRVPPTRARGARQQRRRPVAGKQRERKGLNRRVCAPWPRHERLSHYMKTATRNRQRFDVWAFSNPPICVRVDAGNWPNDASGIDSWGPDGARAPFCERTTKWGPGHGDYRSVGTQRSSKPSKSCRIRCLHFAAGAFSRQLAIHPQAPALPSPPVSPRPPAVRARNRSPTGRPTRIRH